MSRQTVSCDFDGVLHTYASGWTGYEPLDGVEPGSLEMVNELIELGYRVVVVSSRAHITEGKEAIEVWLARNGFPALEVTHEKVLAVAYIDDRAVPYTTGSGAWQEVVNRVDALAARARSTDYIPNTVTSTGETS